MKEHKVVEDYPRWTAPVPSQWVDPWRGTRDPSPPPETRKPLLWITRDGHDLLLINETGETLTRVQARSDGFQTLDDEVMSITEAGHGYDYRDVAPGNAVKVDEYDDYYDLDFVLGLTLRVTSARLGCLEIFPPPAKGGVHGAVLLWDTGESGKRISVDPCEAFDED
ncbi:hypothetical protein [Thiocapsa roseopersicina]|uniref:Uncharacterized protein n=1 Tax=Thiocapsa roseopersicina TaxID=1058 RepID=A0A1H2X835_THIRO|nr:hypothetical protein [Thiocapsa roseopersicina]SDW89030.1 hypothetical protein SAMN05421783_11072 [Thiocapsa roseopersicina]